MSKIFSYKRFISVFLCCIIMTCTDYASVMAAEAKNAEDISPGFSTYPNIGNLITEGSTVFSSNGTIRLHLNQSYSKIWIRVASVNNPSNVILCEFTAPNDKTYSLGFINGNGEKSDYFLFPSDGSSAPAGDYVFTFLGTSPGTTGALAFLYEAY